MLESGRLRNGLFPARQRKCKGTAVTGAIGLDPDSATMNFDNSFGQGQAYAAAFDARIEPFEKAKYVVVVARVDADSLCARCKRATRLSGTSARTVRRVGAAARCPRMTIGWALGRS